ncbi:MAG: tetratricopeptide repeat protein, partial [bacterium]
MVFVLFLTGISYAQKEIDDCNTYIDAGDYQRAIEAGKKVVKLYPKNVAAYLCLGRAYSESGQIDLAIDNLKKAESYAIKDEDLMFIYNFLGITYERKGDLDNALFYHSKSLNLAKKLGDRNQEAFQLNNIAIIFYKKGELDKALEYYEESLRLKTNEKDKATIYNNIALVYVDKGDYKRAIEYLKEAIEIAERYGDYHGSG